MHTSIMRIKILQNIKAVALTLYEELAGQSLYAASTKKMTKVQLLVILRIFEENQNLVDIRF
jgi:hypothetical protein